MRIQSEEVESLGWQKIRREEFLINKEKFSIAYLGEE